NAGVTVLDKSTNGLSGVNNLECVERRRQRGDDISLGHGHVHHAVLQQRMAAGQKMILVHVSDGAGGRGVHVSTDEHSTYGRAGLKRLRLLFIAGPAHAHYGNNAGGGKLVSEGLDCSFAEAVEDKWCINRREELRVILNLVLTGSAGCAGLVGDRVAGS